MAEGAGGPNPPDVVISIDAMGGDNGPSAVVAGIAKAASKDARIRFLLHGDEPTLAPLVARRKLGDRVALRHAEAVVTMDAKPSQVMRRGSETSMWSAIEAVREGEATVAVSTGNTGALMAVSMLRLRKMPGIGRPALACFWPSLGGSPFNVLLDVGADVRADEGDLLQFALLGAAYARAALGVDRPRVGLLNVGTEENKGRPELRAAHELIEAEARSGALLDYVGFVEGGDLPSDRVDVIVTDGFTGNVALKTGEGTARLMGLFLKEAFAYSPLSRIASLLALTSMNRLRKRMDPRRVNGGVFLGLNGTVVKSHGSADATGIAAAIELAARLARADFTAAIRERLRSEAPDERRAPA
jgi:glycerol-3-phosphate acyltransferase PlsX